MRARGKTFFNEAYDENGHIKWQIKSGKDVTYRGDTVTGELTIADCSKSIYLDFDCEKPRHIDKRIAKIDIIIEELMAMRSALEKAKEEHNKATKFYY